MGGSQSQQGDLAVPLPQGNTAASSGVLLPNCFLSLACFGVDSATEESPVGFVWLM